jgi:selenocysteine lyase/cysteine desulfurase
VLRGETADFVRFRAGFPGAVARPYLNVADRGLLSTHVRQSIDAYLEGCMTNPRPDEALVWIELARRRFANLVQSDENEIAIVKNVSDGINAFAWSIAWRPGDNVVICGTLEHPSNRYPWHSIRDRYGVMIREASNRGGCIDPDRLAALIDDRTRVVSVSMVSFAPGFRTDVGRLGATCQSRGVLLLVDAAQSAGVLDIDLRRLPIDALAAGTPKALLGLYGLGFLFVRAALAESLRPAYLSQMGIEPPVRPDGRMTLKSGARRFEVGNFNQVGCVAAATSIGQLLSLGTENIERHVIALSNDLTTGLQALDVPVLAADRDDARSHIVSVGRAIEDTLDDTSDPDLKDLHRFLDVAGIRTSIRRGVLRLAVHAYNDEQDVAMTIDAVRRWRASAGLRFAMR